MKSTIRRLRKDVLEKQKIINNLNMLMREQVDNELTTNFEVDLDAERRQTKQCKFEYNVNREVRFPCTQ
jgi:hypothetical protein